jgi:hypothetical protein
MSVRHYAYVPRNGDAGVIAEQVSEWASRLEAQRAALRLLNNHGGGEAVSIEGHLADGDLVPTDSYLARR